MRQKLVLILFMSLFSNTLPAQVQNKSFSLVLKMMLSEKTPSLSVADVAAKGQHFLLLDAREKEEYNVSHLPEARFVGYKEFNLAALSSIPKSQPIVVYCAIGKRSEAITQKLQKAGFTQVHNLYGGIFEWVNREQPIVDANNKPTNKVHAYSRFWGQWLQKGIKVY